MNENNTGDGHAPSGTDAAEPVSDSAPESAITAAEPTTAPASDTTTTPPSGAKAWLIEGLRAMTLRAPRWERLQARPGLLVLLVAAGYLLDVGAQRLFVDGQARFYWQAVLNGWGATALMVWLCWIATDSRQRRDRPGPDTATLFALGLVVSLLISLVSTACYAALQASLGPSDKWPDALHWPLWGALLAWAALAGGVLIWRVAAAPLARLAVVLVLPLAMYVANWLQPSTFWWPQRPAAETSDADEEPYGLPMTEEVLEAQPQLLADAFEALQPPRPNRVNVYALTYAPYASEDVFMRESGVVADSVGERFDAKQRTLQLVMNPATATTLPWATPSNLRRAIERMAAVMDRERDVLFIHLTSHGGKDGRLAVDAWPLDIEPLTPDLLKRWLDDAGIRWRVLSVSACYSGSWIEPLAGDGTLVMTAADATHTSYGCGKRSPLTYFGQAMYVDALKDTWSFTQAHARARELIEVREREAGKKDGYSNPQISEGEAIRAVLSTLEQERRGR